MLFYESAKCLHGRRSQLKGKYYGSIFVHYQPVDQSIWDYSVDVSSFIVTLSLSLSFFFRFLVYFAVLLETSFIYLPVS